jgi:general secretion pathway protein N
MRRVLRYTGMGLVFCLLFAIFLAATAPATWLAWGVARGSQGVVNINTPTGSLWSGKGMLVIHRASDVPRALGGVTWKIEPLVLVLGRLRLNLSLDGSGIQAKSLVDLSYNTLALRDLRAEFPAKTVTTFYAPAALLAPEGQLDISADSVSMQKRGVHGSVQANWRSASLSLSSVKPLGNYRLYLNGHGESADVEVNTESGSLAIAGKGSLVAATGQFVFNGTARASAHAAELEPLLGMMGPDQGGGQRQLHIRLDRLY